MTLTIGLTAGPVVAQRRGRLPGVRLRGVEPAVRHAHRQGGRRLRHDPGARRVVGGIGGRADLDVHAAGGSARGPTANRSPPRTSPTRSTVRATRSGSTTTPRCRTSRPPRSTNAPCRSSASVPDPKLPTMDVYIVPKHIYESISADDLLVLRRPRRRRFRAVLARGVAVGAGLDDGQEPQLVRPRQRHRPHRVPRLLQPRRDGRGHPARRDRRRPRLSPRRRSSNSRPTRTSRSSTVSKAASPSWH